MGECSNSFFRFGVLGSPVSESVACSSDIHPDSFDNSTRCSIVPARPHEDWGIIGRSLALSGLRREPDRDTGGHCSSR
jgi:hypothetical protein